MTTQPQPEAFPPLPDPAYAPSLYPVRPKEYSYTADQMRAYATEHAARLHAECEALRADAERWRCFRAFVAGKSTRGFLNGKPAAYMVLPAITVERVGMTLDESIDAARAAKEQSK